MFSNILRLLTFFSVNTIPSLRIPLVGSSFFKDRGDVGEDGDQAELKKNQSLKDVLHC